MTLRNSRANPRDTLYTLALVFLPVIATAAHAEPRYAWVNAQEPASQSPLSTDNTLATRIAPPPGFTRVAALPGSWAEWLRSMPLKPDGAPVLTYTGAPKWRQDVHVAVLDIDVGKRDLQQCADAVMRLRAEWLYASNRKSEIAFNDTDGKRRVFSKQSKQDYPAFRKYMDLVFAYAGTYSLDHELKAVAPGPPCKLATCSSEADFPAMPCWWPIWWSMPQPAKNASCCCRATCRHRTSTF